MKRYGMPMARRTSVAVFLTLIAILMALLFLSHRNIYDDELGSFRLIFKPMLEIWKIANSSDIHPPGMYILSRIFYLLIPSVRWMCIGPILWLYSGILIFILRYKDTFDNWWAFVIFGLICTMHPHLLMWGNSIRWYPYWTSLALIALAIAFVPDHELNSDPLTPVKCIGISIILTMMFYINYLTIFFLFAFIPAFLVRYKLNTSILAKFAATIGSFCIFIVPQLFPFIFVHLRNRGRQESSLIVSFLRLAHGVFIGEALLPWNPIAVIVALLFAIPMLTFLMWSTYKYIIKQNDLFALLSEENPLWISFMIFFLIFLILGGISGLGGKPRSFLCLVFIWGYLVAYGFTRVKRQYIHYIALGIIILWIGCGYSNLLLREGTAKGEINDHPETVLSLLKKEATGKKALIFTHDIELTYYINQHKGNQDWVVCSVYPDYVHAIHSGFIPLNYKPDLVFLVKSFVGALAPESMKLQFICNLVKERITAPAVANLCPDSDVNMIKRIPWVRKTTKLLPYYRYVVFYGKPSEPDYKWTRLAHMWRGRLSNNVIKLNFHNTQKLIF